jgi:hypothetical protein
MRTKGGYIIRPLKLRYPPKEYTTESHHFLFEDFGWATFIICDKLGELSVQSDWGCWGHRWNPDHLGESHKGSLTSFLATSDPGYITNKLSYSMPPNTREIPCESATGKSMRSRVIEARRTGEIDKEAARELWGQVDDLMGQYAEGGVDVAYYNMERELCDVLGDTWEYFETEEAPCLVILRERLIPFLQEELRGKEQQREA